jgi:3,4-dihydroxy-2-butanone 4-phosphate synthase
MRCRTGSGRQAGVRGGYRARFPGTALAHGGSGLASILPALPPSTAAGLCLPGRAGRVPSLVASSRRKHVARTSAGTGLPAAGQLEQVERAVADFARGQFVIVFDDESRENEGDLMIAAEHTDHKAMAYMLSRTAGVVCAAVPFDRCDELDLSQMVTANSGLHGTAFTVSVDVVHGATTGIPAPERARTIRALADPASRPGDLARPGHVFPIRAARGGVLERGGHTEAAVDLSRLAGLSGVTAICEIVLPDGSMARYHHLKELADREDLALISVGDLIAYRMLRDNG